MRTIIDRVEPIDGTYANEICLRATKRMLSARTTTTVFMFFVEFRTPKMGRFEHDPSKTVLQTSYKIRQSTYRV